MLWAGHGLPGTIYLVHLTGCLLFSLCRSCIRHSGVHGCQGYDVYIQHIFQRRQWLSRAGHPLPLLSLMQNLEDGKGLRVFWGKPTSVCSFIVPQFHLLNSKFRCRSVFKVLPSGLDLFGCPPRIPQDPYDSRRHCRSRNNLLWQLVSYYVCHPYTYL